MTTVFLTRPYGRFIEIMTKLRRKKLHRMKQNSIFLTGSFSNKNNTRAPTRSGLVFFGLAVFLLVA